MPKLLELQQAIARGLIQEDALLDAHPLNLTKLLLTYLVPYCVATYGAVSYQLAQGRRARSAPANSHLPI